MSVLLDRLRQALAPDYEVERELNRGGMGIVFLGRDPVLDKPVAIKVLRPELATAVGAERFLREARLLAKLRHPHVIPVHVAKPADGLFCYIMDFIQEPTLETRLGSGPLSAPEVIQLGLDLLDALEAIHALGVVHRDIKPNNIFVVQGRALLTDFGIARSDSSADHPLTQPGTLPGTQGYMAPEQMTSGTLDRRADLYAAGIVLYEAFTGCRWQFPVRDNAVHWFGVPPRVVPVLRKALAWHPDQRWQSALAFRNALQEAARERHAMPRMAQAAAGLGLVALAFIIVHYWPPRPTPIIRPRLLQVQRFSVTAPPERSGLGDSLSALLVRELAGNPDFAVGGADPERPADVVIGGTIQAQDGRWCAVMRAVKAKTASPAVMEACAANGLAALADSLTRRLLLEIWQGGAELVEDLPRRALPQTAQGVAAWLAAERLYAEARWGDAREAYLAAERTDSTCWLCLWRLSEVERWLGEADPERKRALQHRYLAHLDSFPPHYRTLIRASVSPTSAHLDTLERLTQRNPRFVMAWLLLGDELFHRGPLVGRARRDAIEPLVRATVLNPGFAPAWEHLAWVQIAEGDSTGARASLHALDSATGRAPRDVFSLGLRVFLQAGYLSRFTGPGAAALAAQRALKDPDIAAHPGLAQGPRLFPTMGAFAGELSVGEAFAGIRGRPDLVKSGLLARVFAHVALGHPDSARVALDRLLARFPEAEFALFGAELEGLVSLVDSEAVPGWRDAAHDVGRRLAETGAGLGTVQGRADRLLRLLGEPVPVALRDRDTVDVVMDRLLAADALARAGRLRQALERVAGLDVPTDRLYRAPELRALLRLRRAAWLAATGNVEAARLDWRWAEHYDVDGFPGGPPQGAEFDWALRPLAHWQLARTLDDAGVSDDEVCRDYQRVARLWSHGATWYRQRADTAEARFTALGCSGPS